jgi:uncharacterized protein YlbG (UPF0298 family)
MRKLLIILFLLLPVFISGEVTPTPTPNTTTVSIMVNTVSCGKGWKPDINYELEKYLESGYVIYNRKYDKCVIVMTIPNENLWIIQGAMMLAFVSEITVDMTDEIEKEFVGYKNVRYPSDILPAKIVTQ